MKKYYKIYIVVVALICIIPTITIGAFKANDNRQQLTKKPELMVDGNVNTHFLTQVNDYFTDHFGFREWLISTDAKAMESLMNTSNNQKVIVGSNDWLYFSETLDDYMEKKSLSKRGAYRVAKTIQLIQQYVTDKGKNFVFTIAPNKNSIYPENMPDYILKGADGNNYSLVKEELVKLNVNYFDIFTLFENENDIMYLATDSHWNNKGAALAYTKLLESINVNCKDYSTEAYEERFDYKGDLAEMLYPKIDSPTEINYYYGCERNLNITNNAKSVEDIIVNTENEAGNGTLLMFRDSFGNAIIPYFADSYNMCFFSKAVPYNFKTLDIYRPDDVIIELVERHLDSLCDEIPHTTGIKSDIIVNEVQNIDCDYTVDEINEGEFLVKGTVNSEIPYDTDIYLKINDGDIYEAFPCGETDNDFGTYIKTDSITKVQVMVDSDKL